MKLGKITITAVGKLKTDHWRSAQTEYIKRLNHYSAVSLIEVRDSIGKGFPDSVAVQKEGNSLLEATKSIPFKIALSIKGQQLDSLAFASTIRRWIENYGEMAFIIGGPNGLSSDVLQQCQSQLSLSTLTLPHELARIVLLEQLYRAATILSNHKYHK